MCDTIVACKNATRNGVTLFGKNSDREPDEAQNLIIIEPPEKEPKEVQCTYVRAPLYRKTCRAFICRPFWMYGAEMGVNEHGVAIGNEALFTREKPAATGLTGMDILRLALVQSRSAAEARDTIIQYLSEKGQGGKAGYRHKIRYMNGYIIADPDEAYVLETVKSWWAWKRIKRVWSISNLISLTQDFDECDPGLIENAVRKGYVKTESAFDFRECYSDRLYTRFAQGRPREKRSRQLLQDKKGDLTTGDFFDVLRDHGPDPHWRPNRQKGGTVCMHATNPLTRPNQSVCSMVAGLGKQRRLLYTTGASNPCMSRFFPVDFPRRGLPGSYQPAGAAYDPQSYWWEAERVHRRALFCFNKALDLVKPLIKQKEEEMVRRWESEKDLPEEDFADKMFADSRRDLYSLEDKLANLKPERTGFCYRRYWKRLNRKNGITAEVSHI
ncbi:MAG: carcinine hydrolase/isopenicillin-N N-acyltransferase family protein [bacterium]